MKKKKNWKWRRNRRKRNRIGTKSENGMGGVGEGRVREEERKKIIGQPEGEGWQRREGAPHLICVLGPCNMGIWPCSSSTVCFINSTVFVSVCVSINSFLPGF